MIRQRRRRIERKWIKVKVCEICTSFIERNNLFSLPHVIAFQAVKVSDELVCVYNIGLFDYNIKDGGHGEFVTIVLFVNGMFQILNSIQIAFIPEGDLWENEEIDV